MTKKVFFILLVTAMLIVKGATMFVCKYCGETFSSASGARSGYCTYSASHKHTAISVNGKYVCQFCGEKFSSPGGVRTGYCTKNDKNHKHCLP